MVNKDIITSRIEQIEKHLLRISGYNGISCEDFSKNITAQDVVEYNLFQIINHLIDIVQHIAVDEEYGFPQTAYEAAEMLKEKDILSGKDLEILRKMIGFRNAIGHDYIKLNKTIIYSIMTEGIADIKEIISKIAGKFL